MPGPVLLSDIGNVLTFFDFTIAAQRVSERCPFPPEALSSRLDDIKGPFENGDMDDDTFVRAAIQALEFQGTTADFVAIWCDIFIENEAMKRSLAPLVGKVPMKLLSNTSGLHKDYLLRTFDIFRPFTGGVYSYSAKCSKPWEPIFRVTIEELDLDPAQTFYIDDLEPNIATARSLGFDVHHYHHQAHDRLDADLTAWARKHGLAV
ncbi:putative hydrolase of the HAD superfamily [Prosthecobacter fusiformis]|uniref:Putative hydrolase of the HAD superfamily n=1 Tax=Prosthecobacter fusiformis TaxID=48464 RepID=A0A4R7RP02_9BACT|nr:hypothetical protein [Prosthecobacter fusiformis]TDU67152.1 putative hydrolase of the HAD superfamily [Prosthecobacter fusiformis]